jgi:hypothetical protein
MALTQVKKDELTEAVVKAEKDDQAKAKADLEAAKAAIQAEKTTRGQQCLAKVRQVCDEYRCVLGAIPRFNPNGQVVAEAVIQAQD